LTNERGVSFHQLPPVDLQFKILSSCSQSVSHGWWMCLCTCCSSLVDQWTPPSSSIWPHL